VGGSPLLFEFEPALADALHRLRSADKLNRRDATLLARGYYEDVTDVVRFNTQLAELYSEMPPDWTATPHILETPGEYPPYRLRPSAQVTFRREPLSTNRWGMRDRAYEREKAPGTLRVAILGDSHTFGSGVQDHQTYENLVEDRLNRENGKERRYEILNFSVGGYGPLSRLVVLEREAFSFDPDLVLYVGVDDFSWILNELAYAVENGFAIPYERAAEAIRASGIEGRLPRIVAERRLAPQVRELLAWVYGEFVARALERGIRPVAIFIPQPEGAPGPTALIAEQTEIAERAGFTVLDVSAAYAGVDAPETLWVARWDRHPNARGHRMLADALYRALEPHLTRR
jgi:lysophospholipase L1-like esterase